MARKKRPEGSRRPNGASSIYFSESDGKWHGWVTVGVRDNGKTDRRHVQRKDEGDVIEAVRELEKQRDGGKVKKPGRAWTVEKWLKHWVENIAAHSVRETTMVGYRAAVYGHLIPEIGAHRIDKLRPEHLESMYRRLTDKIGKHGKKLKPATIHQAHRTVRTALGEAVRRGHILSNPAQIARPPRIPEEEIIPFTKEEAKQILKACDTHRNGTRFVIALTLGLRKGEALGLQWRDIDLEARTLIVRRQIQRVPWQHGCPDEDPCGRQYAGHCPQKHGGGALAREVKSRAGRRALALPLALVDALKRHREDQERERVLAGDTWQEEGWVFTNRIGKPVHPKIDHEQWKVLLRSAGVRDARLHDARHTAATMLLVLGVPARAVMDMMGWSHISITKRYQHVSAELRDTIAGQIGGLYWSDDDGDDGSAGVPSSV